MPVAEGFFNYRPDVITSEGKRKPYGFTGNVITGEVPIAEWSEPHNAYRLLDNIPPAPIRGTSRPPLTDSADTNATAGYVEPKDPPSSKSGVLAVMIPILIIGAVILVAMKVFKRG